MQEIAHDLTAAPNRLIVSVGFKTRTSDTKAALARFTLRPRKSESSLRMRNALAGVSTRLVMAGGRRHVQSESLKASGLSHWQVLNPRLPRLSRGAGLQKPLPVSTTMDTPKSAPAPRFLPFIFTGKSGDLPRTQAKRLALYAAGALRSKSSRQAVEDLIELLIACLDDCDGCPDMEDGGDCEPWIGARELGSSSQASWSIGADDSREWDDYDYEPSLGSLERGPEASQTMLGVSGSLDLEGEAQ